MAGGRVLVLAVLFGAAVFAQDHHTPSVSRQQLASCYNEYGQAQRCLPPFENAAYGIQIQANNTCGENGDTMFCIQRTSSRKSCDVCTQDRFHSLFLTDLHHEHEDQTWWQSETMYEGIQYPNKVNLELNLGKAFDITYVRLVFYSPRPESFAIYKRTSKTSDWQPYQFYSAACRTIYGLPESKSADKGAETRALCTSEYSDISPLKGGNVAFSTLEGRPSAYSFESSTELQEWVTATDIRITLNRLNTFGDEVFGDPAVLQSYWYAIADIAVGARCKCNGHASNCTETYVDGVKQRACVCEHRTAGRDCERCESFYNDAPWGRATSSFAYECKPCSCNNFSDTCIFDKELYERTGHGGHCLNCTHFRDGPNCERCKENYYQQRDDMCVPCMCNPTGSRSLQCNSEGKCQCKPGVSGDKCNACSPNHYQFTNLGCKQCLCNEAGSLGNTPQCDSETGVCSCKDNVEGRRCGECRPGYFNLDFENDFGCTPCFCYGHSSECHSALGYSKITLESTFARNNERWTAEDVYRRTIGLKYNGHNRNIAVTSPGRDNIYFVAPEQYLRDQRASYNHDMKFTLSINESSAHTSRSDLVLEGSDMKIETSLINQGNSLPSSGKTEFVFRLHENEWSPNLRPRQFMSLLSNLTSIRIRGTYSPQGTGILDNFKLETAALDTAGSPAHWIETCTCPKGFIGQFCESCAPGYRHSPALGGPFKPCIPCDCNKHTKHCDSETGRCICEHNTAGPNCELCAKGYYGNALSGTPFDCKPCPCPQRSACMQLGDSVVCTECPKGYAGSKCEGCSDGYFGDPHGAVGPESPCRPCDCNLNIDTNAVANCNQTTGECLKCIYNTAGKYCEECLPGFYGDALAPTKGDCRPCECYRMGTKVDSSGIPQCNRLNGQCECKPYVFGRGCDKCQDGYYNIVSGEGCQLCMCNTEGSYNGTCDVSTGQCHCKPGVTGRQCDQCEVYQYGFSSEGCKECMCDPIGSKGLQCDSNGQCPCYDNVEGRRCDMCKENKYDKQKGCIDCHPCYNLVQDAVNFHRNKLRLLEKLLHDIEKSPTVIKDDDFDLNLTLLKNKIDDLLKKSNKITGDEGKTLVQKLDDFNSKLDQIKGQLENITSISDNALQSEKKSSDVLKGVSEKIEDSRAELESALEYLQNDGVNALAKAQNRSDQFGQQSTQMSQIAQNSRMITENLEKNAQDIINTAQGAYNRSNEAYNLAKSGLSQQANISNELRLMRGEMDAAETKVKEVGTKAANALKRATAAFEKSIELQSKVQKLVIPDIDVNKTRGDAEEILYEAKNINDKINNYNVDNEEFLNKLEAQTNDSQRLLNETEELQAEIEELLTMLDVIASDADKAIQDVNKKYNEAKAINNTLKTFQTKVQTSREEANAALKKIPAITETINNLSRVRESLDRAEENAKNAKEIAEDAHMKFAKKASEDAENVKSNLLKARESAQTLQSEIKQLPGRVKMSADLILDAESKNDNHANLTTLTQLKVSQVKIDVEHAEKAVKKSLDEVTSIMDHLKNLPNLNEEDLNSLEKRIEEAEKELIRANLAKQIKDLQTIKLMHQTSLKDYEDQVKKLEGEVSNVKDILDALPQRCFRQLTLEPK